VVLLLLDATQGVTDQDAHIAGFILESGRAVVLAVNKWDAVDDYQRECCSAPSKQRLAFLKFAERCCTSRPRSGRAWARCGAPSPGLKATRKMPTPVLTRLLLEAVQFQAPKRAACSAPSCAMPTRAA
jgi:GTP-binding protein